MSDSRSSIVGRSVWLLQQFRKQIWVRASLFSVAAVATALVAALAGPYIPVDLELSLAAGSVDAILAILASSMLAVTTFSLSVMVSAYASATSSVTPHSIKLLLADSIAQNTLATFVGSFLFSIVGIIGLAAGVYGNNGRVVLFAVTLVVIFLITATLLRWIEQLGKFGRVGDTILRVEDAATAAIRDWGRQPRLGCRPAVPIPPAAVAITCDEGGHLQHVDVGALADIAAREGLSVHIAILPGAYVYPGRPIAFVDPPPGSDVASSVVEAFTLARDREFEQDPRFGLIVLSEIASRALSPAVNDPGTAIDVLGSGLRILLAYAVARSEAEPPRHSSLFGPDLEMDELFQAFFGPVARDGAAFVEVQMRIQFALCALARTAPDCFASAAADHGRRSLAGAVEKIVSAAEIAMLRERAAWIDRP